MARQRKSKSFLPPFLCDTASPFFGPYLFQSRTDGRPSQPAEAFGSLLVVAGNCRFVDFFLGPCCVFASAITYFLDVDAPLSHELRTFPLPFYPPQAFSVFFPLPPPACESCYFGERNHPFAPFSLARDSLLILGRLARNSFIPLPRSSSTFFGQTLPHPEATPSRLSISPPNPSHL